MIEIKRLGPDIEVRPLIKVKIAKDPITEDKEEVKTETKKKGRKKKDVI